MDITNYLFESGVSLAIFYGAYYLLLKKEASFTLSRIYLMSAVAVSYLLPVLHFQFPQQGLTGELASVSLTPVVINAENTGSSSLFLSLHPALIIYLAGAGVVLGRMLLQFAQIILLSRKGIQIRQGKLKLISTGQDHPPFSFFNYVFMGNQSDYAPHELSIILKHEQAHMQKLHSIDLIITRIACAIQWFNPFIWLIFRSIKEVHEYEADRGTLGRSVALDDYQHLLVNMSAGHKEPILTHTFHSIIKKRIIMLHKSKSLSGTVKGAIFIPLASALIFVFACAENGENTISQTDKSSPQETKSESSSSTTDEIFFIVEEMPVFKGEDQTGLVNKEDGPTRFMQYIHQHVEYPPEAIEQQIQGKVMAQFVVNEEGFVEQAVIIDSAHPLLDEEALKVIENSPQWEPGKQRGQKVKVQFTVPVEFRLNK